MHLTDFSTIKKKAISDTMKLRASAEAKICFYCPLLSKKCRPLSCKRYKEELKKLKEQKNER